jgi:hypothetical protein
MGRLVRVGKIRRQQRILENPNRLRSRVSSVSIVTRVRNGQTVVQFRQVKGIFLFFETSGLALGPTQPPV